MKNAHAVYIPEYCAVNGRGLRCTFTVTYAVSQSFLRWQSDLSAHQIPPALMTDAVHIAPFGWLHAETSQPSEQRFPVRDEERPCLFLQPGPSGWWQKYRIPGASQP